MTDLPILLRRLAGSEETASAGLADRALRRAHQRSQRRGVLAAAGAAMAVVLVVGAVLTGLPRTQTAPAAPAPVSTGRVNVLVLGSDAGSDRFGTRPDTIMVVSIDRASGRTVLFGLPRGLQHVPFPAGSPQATEFPHGWYCAQEACLLNSLWTWAEGSGAKYYPGRDKGLTATTQAAEQITGLEVDETVTVSMTGLAKLVDAVGGVDVNVRERLPIGGNSEVPTATRWLEAGEQHLNGYQALWYARSRWSTNDYDRMGRQQCLIGALIDQVDGRKLLTSYPRIAAALKTNLSTSITTADLPTWVELTTRMRGADLRSVTLSDHHAADPDYPALREQVRQTLSDQAAPSSGSSSRSSGGSSSGARTSVDGSRC